MATPGLTQSQEVYIYAEIDLDKVYSQVTSRSKPVAQFLEDNQLGQKFLDEMQQCKFLRICLDFQLQKFIHRKELNPDLKAIKKHVLHALEELIIAKFTNHLDQKRLKQEYDNQVDRISELFSLRLNELKAHPSKPQ